MSSNSKYHISENSVAIVRATAPVVKDNILKITEVFYTNMLGRNPQLYKYFNESNQRNNRQASAFSDFVAGKTNDSEMGCPVSSQSKTLADAVVAYAINIDNLEVLSDAVTRIAHKHCALNVQPEDYQIVHDNLMEAIGEVLGSAVTAEVAAAWSEAVMGLARICIGVEAGLYGEAAKNQWSGAKDFKIIDIIDEAEDVKSIRMKAADDSGICPFAPGQYITVYENPSGRDYFAPRHYTLTSQATDNYYQITVKRAAEPVDQPGIMSNYLHTKSVGDIVKLGAVYGPPMLRTGENKAHRVAAFISCGIGVTPMVASLPAAIQDYSRVAVFHADRDSSTFAFHDHIKGLLTQDSKHIFSISFSDPKAEDEKLPFFSPGRLTGDKINQLLQDAGVDLSSDIDYYMCCNLPTTVALVKDLKKAGVDKSNMHVEFFGPFVSVHDD